MGYVFVGVRGYVDAAIYVRAIGKRTLYVRVFGGVRGYVDGHSHKTVLPTLLKRRGPGTISRLQLWGPYREDSKFGTSNCHVPPRDEIEPDEAAAWFPGSVGPYHAWL